VLPRKEGCLRRSLKKRGGALNLPR
jgi:hypothetical protein